MPARIGVVAPAALLAASLALTACGGSKGSTEEAFCGKVKAAAADGGLALDASALQSKETLKAAIDKVSGGELLTIKDAEVPAEIRPQVVMLRTSFEKVRTTLEANGYDVGPVINDLLGLQTSATAVAAYVKTNCGVDLLPTTTSTSAK